MDEFALLGMLQLGATLVSEYTSTKTPGATALTPTALSILQRTLRGLEFIPRVVVGSVDQQMQLLEQWAVAMVSADMLTHGHAWLQALPVGDVVAVDPWVAHLLDPHSELRAGTGTLTPRALIISQMIGRVYWQLCCTWPTIPSATMAHAALKIVRCIVEHADDPQLYPLASWDLLHIMSKQKSLRRVPALSVFVSRYKIAQMAQVHLTLQTIEAVSTSKESLDPISSSSCPSTSTPADTSTPEPISVVHNATTVAAVLDAPLQPSRKRKRVEEKSTPLPTNSA